MDNLEIDISEYETEDIWEEFISSKKIYFNNLD